jgi:hypothetical protein
MVDFNDTQTLLRIFLPEACESRKTVRTNDRDQSPLSALAG